MEIDEYFAMLSRSAEAAYSVAGKAREKGYDPETSVEIKPAPDLASRVEGIIGFEGIAAMIREKQQNAKDRQYLAFKMVEELCTNEKFTMDTKQRITLALRVGLSILTEGILVAPTEGMPGIEIHRNPDGTDYLAILYAGPIRSAGGTSVALSAVLGDYARRFFGIGQYKAQKAEVERCIEEIMLYHARAARLQYLPSEQDIRVILENCPVCIDGLPTEELEVSVHRNIKRIDSDGNVAVMTNRVRGGVALVTCEGIAQKAKNVMKYSKSVGLDWSWLSAVIRVGKSTQSLNDGRHDPAFLTELVGGRPVIAYPDHSGAFRLRYGRSRFTGMAAKGFSPATMIILDEFIAVGTQVKIEKPGKGSVAMPVDTIEGPFVKLKSGEAMRINTAEQARLVKSEIAKIISVGDMLITLGDFKKTNTQLSPSSYVEEFWSAQLRESSYNDELPEAPSFEKAYLLSMQYKVPMHPRYLYEYQNLNVQELSSMAKAVSESEIKHNGSSIFDVEELVIPEKIADAVRQQIESICIPHTDNGSIKISGGDAQSLIATLGLAKEEKLDLMPAKYTGDDPIAALNTVAPFRIMQRSYTVGARIGRPEKARERLMKPAPNVLFPIGEAGGKERNISKAYMSERKQMGSPGVEVELASYRCPAGGEQLSSAYCATHNVRAYIERRCVSCGKRSSDSRCVSCGGHTTGSSLRTVSIARAMDSAIAKLGMAGQIKTVKGVKGLTSGDKIPEPLEKGILRSVNGISTFKDGTSRFDATDAPMTHFYPKEVSISIEALAKLGYTHDYMGNKLENDDQLVEIRHQDLVINRRCAEHMLKVAKFVDDLLVKYYGLEPFYSAANIDDLIGQCVITLSPHTSAGVLGRIIGFTDANVGFAHPFTIAARRRNCDGDEDTTMLLLDALINFSRRYLPSMIGGTMDAPLILTVNVRPEEVDDEAWQMETVQSYGIQFYNKTLERAQPSDVKVESIADRLNTKSVFDGFLFTHESTARAIDEAPKKSIYTKLKTMDEKVEMQFNLMDKLYSIDRRDTARRLISNHFIRDLMGNLHSYSEQGFRCVSCNSKYRRIPLVGKCTRCGGRIILTISKGGIEKYLGMAIELADRYDLEPYMKQRLKLIKEEIETVFGVAAAESGSKQFNLSRFM